MQETIIDPGVRTATELFDLYRAGNKGLDSPTYLDETKIIPIRPMFNGFLGRAFTTSAGYLHLGPVGIVTDEVYAVNYKPYGHEEGLFSTEKYQMVLFNRDSGQPLVDPNSNYIKGLVGRGTPFSPTGVYYGQRPIILGGCMQPVFKQAVADVFISMMRDCIHVAHRTNCYSRKASVDSTLLLEKQ